MVTLNAHFDGKVFVPDEPLDLPANQKVRISVEPVGPGAVFAPWPDPTAALANGGAWDEADSLHIDPLDAVPGDFVRRPGSAAGQVRMADDFDNTPAEFEADL